MTEITTVKTQTSIELNKKLKKALKTIDNKLASLGVSQIPPVMQTTGTFKYNENDNNINNINIHNCADVVYLIKSYAMLKRVQKEYTEIGTELALNVYPIPTWLGFPIDKWLHDLEYRIKVVNNAVQIAELKKSKEELSQFLSQEDRLTSTLTKISELLKD